MNKTTTTDSLGDRLRALRMKSGLSLRNLAAASGLNVNTLSLIENNKTSPSANTLQLIANALNVQLTAFFEIEDDQADVAFHKSGERYKSTYLHGALEDLAAGVELRCGKPLLATFRAKSSSGPTPIVHSGYEFVFCIEGTVFYIVEKETYQLEPGDSLVFEAHLPHCWQNPGPNVARLLLMLCPSNKNDDPIERHFYPSFSKY